MHPYNRWLHVFMQLSDRNNAKYDSCMLYNRKTKDVHVPKFLFLKSSSPYFRQAVYIIVKVILIFDV